MRWRALAAIGVALAGAVAAAGVGNSAHAQTANAVRVDHGHRVARWTGGPFEVVPGLPAVSNPRPEVCAVNCEKRALRIDFPSSTWRHPGDGVLVAIHWATTDNGLNLYVYDPAGALGPPGPHDDVAAPSRCAPIDRADVVAHHVLAQRVGKDVYGLEAATRFLDIGTPESFAAAPAFVSRRGAIQ